MFYKIPNRIKWELKYRNVGLLKSGNNLLSLTDYPAIMLFNLHVAVLSILGCGKIKSWTPIR